MIAWLLPSFASELQKISVSSEWVKRRVTSAMAKGVSEGRYTKFADRLVSKANRTFDAAQKSKNYRVHDNYNEALDTAQRWNPFDYPGGKGVKTASDESIDWKEFERKLKSKSFRKEVSLTTVDPKLKRYVENFGESLGSSNIKATVQSRTNPRKEYKIKELPSGRLTCSCKDWQYKHSVGDSDCAHVATYRKFLQGEIPRRTK